MKRAISVGLCVGVLGVVSMIYSVRVQSQSAPAGEWRDYAGDKGFTTPELNAHSLRNLKDAVQYCSEGISTSRTCEIGLTQHGGIDYHGLVYLVDRVTQARAH